MPHVTRLLVVTGLVLATLSLAACAAGPTPVSDSPEPSVDRAEVIEMAEHALDGFNDRDYAAWSRDWSETMRAAIDEAAFLSFRDDLVGRLGRYVSIGEPTLTSVRAGTHRWVFVVRFESGEATMSFGFIDGQPAIEGVNVG